MDPYSIFIIGRVFVRAADSRAADGRMGRRAGRLRAQNRGGARVDRRAPAGGARRAASRPPAARRPAFRPHTLRGAHQLILYL